MRASAYDFAGAQLYQRIKQASMFGDEAERVNRCIARIQKGDIHAFSLLFDMTNGKLTFYARHYLADKQLAEDVVSETYLRLCANIDLLDCKKNMLAWLITVVKHVAFDYNRKTGREVACEEVRPDENNYYEYNGEKEIIKDCVLGLSLEENRLFYLYFIEEKTVRQIAKLLGVSKTTAAQRVAKLKEKLRDRLLASGLNGR